MLGFARGLKSIRSALLNLVESGPGTRQIGPISGDISTHQLLDYKDDEKIMKLTKIFRGNGSQIPRKMGQCDLNLHNELQTPVFHR